MKACIIRYFSALQPKAFGSDRPDCFSELPFNETILSRQLKIISESGIREVFLSAELDSVGKNVSAKQYCDSLNLPLSCRLIKSEAVRNESSFLSELKNFFDDDILFFYDNMVFDKKALSGIFESPYSCIHASESSVVEEHEWQAVISNGRIINLGGKTEKDTVSVLPLFKILKSDLSHFFAAAESCIKTDPEAINIKTILSAAVKSFNFSPIFFERAICSLICSAGDLSHITSVLRKLADNENNGKKQKTVYMCLNSEIPDPSAISLIKRASSMGKLTVGISDTENKYKAGDYGYPGYSTIIENIKGVDGIVKNGADYIDTVRKLKPDFFVYSASINGRLDSSSRRKTLSILGSYGGRFVELP